MWKRRIVDGSILAVLLFVLSTVFAVYPTEMCTNEKGANSEHCAFQSIGFVAISRTARFLDDWNAIILAFATIAIAGFTLTLRNSTDKLWDAGERQLTHFRESSERQLRAYIHITEVKVHPIMKDRQVKADVSIKNFGQTPGYQVKIALAIQILDNVATPPQIQTVSHDATSSVAIYPPSYEYQSVATSGYVVKQFDIDKMVAKEKGAFIFGRIDYIDAFGNECFTEFRVKRAHSDDEPIGAYGGPMVCENGNRTEYDEERTKR